MQIIKRTLALLLALALTSSVLPGVALAAEASEGALPRQTILEAEEAEPSPSIESAAPETQEAEPSEPQEAETPEEETAPVQPQTETEPSSEIIPEKEGAEAPEEAAPIQPQTETDSSSEAAPEQERDALPPVKQTPVDGKTTKSDAEVQTALETFDPTIDDPQYHQEYNRYQESLTEGDNPQTFSSNSYTHKHAKTKYIYYGIDVSQWQGTIDWAKVKKAGVKFAFIRCSYTSLSSFSLHEDKTFAANIKNAYAAGIKVGVYHYSGAISTTEAKKEANYILNLIAPYKNKISLPVVIDYEPGDRVTANYHKTTKTARTAYMTAFCDTVKASGYTPGIYCSTSWYSSYFNPSSLEKYSCWVAQWASSCTYAYAYDFWQYSDSGRISGISYNVDCNFWYTNTDISDSATPTVTTAPAPEPASTALTIPYVTTGTVNYRLAAGTDQAKAGSFPKGTVLDVVYGWYKTVNGINWYKFNYKGNAYYIHSGYLAPEVLQAYTASGSVDYRSAAGSSGTIQDTFDSGAAVQVVQGGDQTADGMTWYKVKVGSSYYYASSQYLEQAETLVPYVTNGTVNVRAKAGTDQTKVTSLHAATPVYVVSGSTTTVNGENWEKIKAGSKYYAILASYLTEGPSCASAPMTKLTTSNAALTLGCSTKPYTGSALKSSVKVTCSGKTLVKDTDYTVAYSNNKEPGTATVKITGAGNYTGSLSKTFTITALTASYVTTGKVNYRSGCGTSYAVKGSVAKGKPVNVVHGWYKSVNGQKWYKVKISDKYYYMSSSYLKYEIRVKYTAKSKLTYRSGAGTGYAAKGTLAKGATLQIIKGWSKKVSGNTWYKVRVGNGYYYVMAKYLTKAESAILYHTNAKVNVRSAAGTNKTLVATFAKGTPVAVVSGGSKTVSGEKWYQIKINTKYYYILASYLQKG